MWQEFKPNIKIMQIINKQNKLLFKQFAMQKQNLLSHKLVWKKMGNWLFEFIKKPKCKNLNFKKMAKSCFLLHVQLVKCYARFKHKFAKFLAKA